MQPLTKTQIKALCPTPLVKALNQQLMQNWDGEQAVIYKRNVPYLPSQDVRAIYTDFNIKNFRDYWIFE